MDFTTEEIKLCKQVAEKYTAESGEGDWFVYEDPESKAGWSKPTLNKSGYQPQYGYGKNIPLWTISDCLEFLEERGLDYIFNFKCFPSGNWSFIAEDNRYKRKRGEGKTRLEACLKVVLTVLKEK